MTTTTLLVLLAIAAHSRSEGTSRFRVDASGRVDIAVELTRLDLPELCDVDLALVDPARRAAMEQRLDLCIERSLPAWLRLRVDDAACTVLPGRWRRGDGLVIELGTEATCPPPTGHAVTIDWGLFHGSTLEHVSAATIALPDGTARRTLFSRRNNRVVVDVPGPRRTVAVMGVFTLAAVVVVAGVVAARVARRWRHRAAGEGDRTRRQ